MKYQSKIKLIYIIPVSIFVLYSTWWFLLRQFDFDLTRNSRQLWGATYQILAIYGGIVGVLVSKKWGGYKSLVGKALLMFSLGLFLQSFGQTFSSWYVYYFNVESPAYPSIGDIGFFGSVIAYIYGVILLSKVGGIKTSLKKLHNKVWAFVVPVIILSVSYFLFLRGYEFDPSNLLKVFFDFGYPFGQALYVSIAIIALLASKNVLGGIMKRPILFIIFALIFQYFSDFFFLYEANLGVWYVGNINDYLYCASYFLMTLALIRMYVIYNNIKEA